METQWFTSCKTVGDVKTRYRQLAKAHHPDLSKEADATKTMQAINAQYHATLEAMDGQVSKGFDGKDHTYNYNQDIEQELMDKIAQVLAYRMPGVDVELIGSWLWVYGDTKPYKEAMKAMGLIWHGQRKKWYYRTGSYRRRYTDVDFDTLRSMYGSHQFKPGDEAQPRGLPSGA